MYRSYTPEGLNLERWNDFSKDEISFILQALVNHYSALDYSAKGSDRYGVLYSELSDKLNFIPDEYKNKPDTCNICGDSNWHYNDYENRWSCMGCFRRFVTGDISLK
jgi:hypothetical protein